MYMARMMRKLGNRLSLDGSHWRKEAKLHHQEQAILIV
jgi:hypothetical protein